MQAFTQLTAVGVNATRIGRAHDAFYLVGNDHSLLKCSDTDFGVTLLNMRDPTQALSVLADSVSQISVDDFHRMVLTDDGQLHAYGERFYDALGTGGDLERSSHIVLRLRERVLQVSANNRHTAIITESGQLWVTGSNCKGQLGLGDKEDRLRFTHVQLAEPVTQVSSGCVHTAVVTESGQLWVCGSGNDGRLGLGDEGDRLTFVRVDLPQVIVQVSAGYRTTAVVTASGQLWLTGSNSHGQTGSGSDYQQLNRFTHVALPEPVKQVNAGELNSLVISVSGRLWGCGRNLSNELGLSTRQIYEHFTPIKLPGVVQQVKLCYLHTMVLTDQQLLIYGNRRDKPVTFELAAT